MNPPIIERLGVEAGERLRRIRLRSLHDAPDAFGSTYEETSARAPESWVQQLRDLATFVAVAEGDDVGIVRGAPDDTRVDAAWLISMWVAPTARGSGVGEALIQHVIEWAQSAGYEELLLDVADDNQPAISLYARMGFEPTGAHSTLPAPRQHIREHCRRRWLR